MMFEVELEVLIRVVGIVYFLNLFYIYSIESLKKIFCRPALLKKKTGKWC